MVTVAVGFDVFDSRVTATAVAKFDRIDLAGGCSTVGCGPLSAA
jgi:hypothetical protein